MSVSEKRRTIENLLRLRPALDRKIALRKSERNLLVASWNIKEFGHTTQRLPERKSTGRTMLAGGTMI